MFFMDKIGVFIPINCNIVFVNIFAALKEAEGKRS